MVETSSSAILALAVAGTFALRAIGCVVAGRMAEDSTAFGWIGCVAFAIAAGLMVKIIVLPSGVLAETAFLGRIGAAGLALVVFYGFGRRLFTSLGVGVLAFVGLIHLVPGIDP